MEDLWSELDESTIPFTAVCKIILKETFQNFIMQVGEKNKLSKKSILFSKYATK